MGTPDASSGGSLSAASIESCAAFPAEEGVRRSVVPI